MTLLDVTDVSKSFAAVRAVDGVSVQVDKAEVVGLIGPNGAGKTTLLNLISGYARPSSGTIRFAGGDIVGLRPHVLARRGLARTYQNLRLFDEASVLENVLIGRHRWFRNQPWDLSARRWRQQSDQRKVAGQLLERLSLSAVADHAVADLPYGLRRRVELARALATEPVLLLLDEPTAGMTRQESDEIGLLIREIQADGVAVVLVDHNVRLVTAACDRVAVMDWGRRIAFDSPDRVWADERVRDAYLGHRRQERGTEDAARR